jgi:hypothetical protein
LHHGSELYSEWFFFDGLICFYTQHIIQLR